MIDRASPGTEEEDPELNALKRKIHKDRGFNCHFYKDKCLRRRLAVRMRARGEESFAGYAALLDRDPAEYDVLLETLTINVSKFFRNPEIWDAVRQEVVPALFDTLSGPTRIWSAGCASGEEPYSISILLKEWASQMGRSADLHRFQIIGTDIDHRSLTAARRAEYQELSLTDTSSELRERWFSSGPPYRLDRTATDNVEFRHVDLISTLPEGNLSLILCRNVIIYFGRDIQEELFQRFYDALRPGGFLVLGKVETLLGRPRSLFRPVNHRARIFQKP